MLYRSSQHSLAGLTSLFVSSAALMLVACGDTGGGGGDLGDTGSGVLPDAITIIDTGVDSADIGADDSDILDTGECATLGCPCEDDVDCESGYCISSRGGGEICSELCDEDCPDGYDCLLLENSGGDAVRLCVEADDPYCDPCEIEADCGSLRAACIEVAEGNACVTPCAEDGRCPSGAECTPLGIDGETANFCVPIDGTCEPCRDEDGDGYGVGPECFGPDPDDDDPNTYPGAPELCDQIDNNGDGRIDEGFDLQTDPAHCGVCDNACVTPSTTGFCEDGACVIESCNPGFEDCDGFDDNGCETDLNDPSRCGDCRAPTSLPGTSCGACGEGTWVCEIGNWDVVCSGEDPERLNTCGGCDALPFEPGAACGTCGIDTYECDGTDAVACSGDSAVNACGGCTELSFAPGDSCGECGAGTWTCAEDAESLICEESGSSENACGGCGVLEGTPDTSCGTCGSGTWTCNGDGSAVTCEGDAGDTARNACGGCGPLPAELGSDCGPCGGEWLCDGAEELACVDAPTDSDGDGTCDPDDLCPGFDDRLDDDGDGIPNDCESECPPGRYGADCSGICDCENGRCSEGLDGDGSCTCDPGYAGVRCDACAAGRYGASCTPCPPCANGSCDDGIGGSGACVCESAWTGFLCDACVDGRYGASCSGACDCDRGSCDDGVSGSGACTCDAGFTGGRCDRCVGGRYGESCAGVCACDRGICDDGRTGDGSCDCDGGFTGARCDECVTGRYGPSCVACPSCASNESCDDGRGGSGACVCVPTSGVDDDCDGIDDDCDGSIDEDGLTTYYRDSDGDGYGSAASGTTTACALPGGYATTNDDCNDGNGSVNPGAAEVVGNNTDENCDGRARCYRDRDEDGYRTTEQFNSSDADCSDPGEALTGAPAGDCVDTNGAINPGRPEACNGIDDNCVAGIDEGVTLTFYRDADSDTFGDPGNTIEACSRPGGYVTNSEDCDDSRGDVNPGGDDFTCDNVDDNCNGSFDEDWFPEFGDCCAACTRGAPTRSRAACVDGAIECIDPISTFCTDFCYR